MKLRTVSRRAVLGAACTLALPSARACEFFVPTLRVYHPWTRATEEGDTTTIASMKIDEVSRADRLINVQTPVAEGAELGGLLASPRIDLEIPQGSEIALSEAGTYVRLTGLRQPLGVGRSFPITFVFAVGGEMPAQLNIDFPGLRFR